MGQVPVPLTGVTFAAAVGAGDAVGLGGAVATGAVVAGAGVVDAGATVAPAAQPASRAATARPARTCFVSVRASIPNTSRWTIQGCAASAGKRAMPLGVWLNTVPSRATM